MKNAYREILIEVIQYVFPDEHAQCRELIDRDDKPFSETRALNAVLDVGSNIFIYSQLK
jgi:hypothetical protein